ncbi:MAG TPA: diaminopimelate epimerase [Acidimicrobiales bacterium]|nr:diaminopimelate epimerase [Acidimicrobiales bacterium]
MRLTKHHGLGNDFLVLLDPDGTATVDADQARALCDRHRGVGADGLIVVGPGHDGADVSMALRNADGSRAEMSGNGIRCLGHAVARDRGADRLDLVVATDAGHRALAVAPGPDARTASVRVDMGPAKVDLEPSIDALVERVALVDIGNPHLVLERDDLSAVDVAGDGARLEGLVPGGVNVEWYRRRPDGDLELVVWERGAGATEACGTGACAVAAADAGWYGGTGDVRVHMPGGSVEVGLGESLSLTGPAVLVATVEVPWP